MQDVANFDAVVIGAGVGGCCAAARLTHAGYHSLLVEARDRVGGRASTDEIDDFKVNVGAIALELGGEFEETFDLVGATLDIREPLVDAPGIVTFGKTQRLCNMRDLTATCPELEPAGWNQYVAYAVPQSALDDFNSEAETAKLVVDVILRN